MVEWILQSLLQYFYILQFKSAKERSQHVYLLHIWIMQLRTHCPRGLCIYTPLGLTNLPRAEQNTWQNTTTSGQLPAFSLNVTKSKENFHHDPNCSLQTSWKPEKHFFPNNVGFLAKVHCQVPAPEHTYNIVKSSYDHERGNDALQEQCIDQHLQLGWEHYCWKWRPIQCSKNCKFHIPFLRGICHIITSSK